MAPTRRSISDQSAIRLATGVLSGVTCVVARELEKHFTSSVFQDDDDLVFANPSTGGPIDRSRVRKRFQASCRRAGVRVVRFHDLRHTFGTHVAPSGDVSLRTLQEWMGHADLKTTQIYTDYEPNDDERELVGKAFSGVDLSRPSA